MSNIYKQLGITIRKHRNDKNLSTQELAKQVSIAPSHLNNIENGVYDVFKLELLTRISKELRIPLKILLNQSFIDTDYIHNKNCEPNLISSTTDSTIKNKDIVDQQFKLLALAYLSVISKHSHNKNKVAIITNHLLEELNFIQDLDALQGQDNVAQ